MTYRFLVQDQEMTIYVEGPYNPEHAKWALMMQLELPNDTGIIFAGTIGVFIPNLL